MKLKASLNPPLCFGMEMVQNPSSFSASGYWWGAYNYWDQGGRS